MLLYYVFDQIFATCVQFLEEFLLGAQRVSRMTPLEVDLLFQLSDLCGDKGRITGKTLDSIAPLEEGSMPYNIAFQQEVRESLCLVIVDHDVFFIFILLSRESDGGAMHRKNPDSLIFFLFPSFPFEFCFGQL